MSVADTIAAKLRAAFQPSWLDVENESHKHNVPANSETHFKVVVVSEQFAGERPVRRHQRVYGALADELQAGVHALAIHTYTEQEWVAAGNAPLSPDCMGGSKKA